MKIALALATFVLATAYSCYGADEKIDPTSYICAELIASAVDGKPPLFEALQLDGYVAGKSGNVIADPNVMEGLIIRVYDSCSAAPTDSAVAHWQEARKTVPFLDEGQWRADKTTCADYGANPDDGSGFVIWLDGYQRAKTGKEASVLSDQASIDNFLAMCAKNPARLMYDVMIESAK